ncbi:Ribosomal protein L38e [Carpediemonas membranifera]|uniref:Ribosomal protein L38e n=1 Tax=Carpediemonas membranifera TaxID=201153 RepID=A0A8J6B298_9EUKA|nr:Ribosomal protein L38e [Carpediemonas membranifera]|eukprot:KAG9394188.1 Ribosomal protein L38e [Carpediemonas membranifera]
MPVPVTEIKQFIEIAKERNASELRVKRLTNGQAKLKLRTARRLYTLTLKDGKRADKVVASLKSTVKKTVKL